MNDRSLFLRGAGTGHHSQTFEDDVQNTGRLPSTAISAEFQCQFAQCPENGGRKASR